jgi:hypothetical protein
MSILLKSIRCKFLGCIKMTRIGDGLNWFHLETKGLVLLADKYSYVSYRTRELYLQVVLLFVFDN